MPGNLSSIALAEEEALAAEGCTVPESVCGFTRYQAERVACRRFFLLAKIKRSETERAKDALHSLGGGGLYGTGIGLQGCTEGK